MLESRGFFPQQPERHLETEKVLETTRISKKITTQKANESGAAASLATQQYMLLLREKNSLIRSPGPMIANVGITALLALIFGVIFFGVGREDRTDLLVSYPSFLYRISSLYRPTLHNRNERLIFTCMCACL
jgi:hypothetical protein